jgi:hypothetical protein
MTRPSLVTIAGIEERMNELRKQEQAAIEAVAGHFSATWEKGEGPPDAYIAIGGKRIAVEIRLSGSGSSIAGSPRSRACGSIGSRSDLSDVCKSPCTTPCRTARR